MSDDVAALVAEAYDGEPSCVMVAPGVPEGYGDIRTLRDLLDAKYRAVGARDQLRGNLLGRIADGSPRYPGILGFDEDVAPSLDRAILAGHDTLIVGQMGQAKTRIARCMAEHLLSPMPVIRGSITNDTPMDLPREDLTALLEGRDIGESPRFHVSPESARAIQDNGLDTPIRWVDGAARSRFVSATPDMSTKDLVGYVDAIKVAKRGVEMYRIESYSPGYLMQSKHGILCVDELPVLDPRKQVALLSVLQEGRFTTGSYPVIFEPRTVLLATANPVDYTHSGRIIEPLHDRLRSHIHTRYPRTIQDEAAIILQEAGLPECRVAEPVLRMLAGVVRAVRESDLISREKGISVRFGIHGLELLVAEARRVRPSEAPCPRPSDFGCLWQAARFELAELDDTVENRADVFDRILEESLGESCTKECPGDMDGDRIRGEFAGRTFVVSQDALWDVGANPYLSQMDGIPALKRAVDAVSPRFGGDGCARAAATEAVLEALRQRKPPVLERRDSGYVSA